MSSTYNEDVWGKIWSTFDGVKGRTRLGEILCHVTAAAREDRVYGGQAVSGRLNFNIKDGLHQPGGGHEHGLCRQKGRQREGGRERERERCFQKSVSQYIYYKKVTVYILPHKVTVYWLFSICAEYATRRAVGIICPPPLCTGAWATEMTRNSSKSVTH